MGNDLAGDRSEYVASRRKPLHSNAPGYGRSKPASSLPTVTPGKTAREPSPEVQLSLKLATLETKIANHVRTSSSTTTTDPSGYPELPSCSGLLMRGRSQLALALCPGPSLSSSHNLCSFHPPYVLRSWTVLKDTIQHEIRCNWRLDSEICMNSCFSLCA